MPLWAAIRRTRPRTAVDARAGEDAVGADEPEEPLSQTKIQKLSNILIDLASDDEVMFRSMRHIKLFHYC
jgi:hypothetical protein